MTPALSTFLAEAEARCEQVNRHDWGEGGRLADDYSDLVAAVKRDLPAALSLLRAFAAVADEARMHIDCDDQALRGKLAAADSALAALCEPKDWTRCECGELLTLAPGGRGWECPACKREAPPEVAS